MPASTPLPEDIRRFVLTSIPSVPFLEAMLVFRRSAGTALTPRALARALYIPEASAAEVAGQLEAARIVAALPGGEYRFAPDNESLAMAVDRVADCYARHLVEISELIHSNTQRTATQFANAFKWRKD